MKEMLWKFAADYGDLASVAGFVLSVIGFGLTLLSARAARRAAEQARKAVMHLRSQLFGHEVGSCLGAIRGIREAWQRGRWVLALRNCDRALIAVPRLRDRSYLTSEENTRMISLIDDLKQIRRTIEQSRHRKRKQIPEAMSQRLSDALVLLSGIEGRLRSPEVER